MLAEVPTSSSGTLSSPPRTPESTAAGSAIVVNGGNAVADRPPSIGTVPYPSLAVVIPAVPTSPTARNGTSSAASKVKEEGAEKPPRKRPARVSANADGKDDKPAKVPRKRAPRKSKEPTANAAIAPSPAPGSNGVPTAAAAPPTGPTGVSSASAAPSTAASHSAAAQIPRPASRQQRITDLVHPEPAPGPNYSNSASLSAWRPPPPENSNAIQPSSSYSFESSRASPLSKENMPSPRSGQRFDPVRSMTVDSPRVYPTTASPAQTSPTKLPNRASASPSISSLIDPPNGANASYSTPSRPSPTLVATKISPSALHAVPAQPTFSLSTTSTRPSIATPLATVVAAKQLDPTDAMDIDSGKATPAQQVSRKTSISNTNPPSKASSPRPPGKKENPRVGTTPPLPPLPGTGAVASLFGGSSIDAKSDSTPTVVLHIPLNGETNVYINFARLAEERYGFQALHPRLAAQRERLAKVAAAGAALENAQKGSTASGDDMSLDGSDAENDMSNVEMGPGSVNGDANGTPAKPRKKRRMKEDEYDKDDAFIDDSELAWEEQAAASKDGFFVYSGPLVPEGETARVERADGTIVKPPGPARKGGRAARSGTGGGARGAAAGNAGSKAAASKANGATTTTTTTTPTAGTGSAPKKPRKRPEKAAKGDKVDAKGDAKADAKVDTKADTTTAPSAAPPASAPVVSSPPNTMSLAASGGSGSGGSNGVTTATATATGLPVLNEAS